MKKIILIIIFLLFNSPVHAYQGRTDWYLINPGIVWEIEFKEKIIPNNFIKGTGFLKLTKGMLDIYFQRPATDLEISMMRDHAFASKVSEYMLDIFIPHYLKDINLHPTLSRVLAVYKCGLEYATKTNECVGLDKYVSAYVYYNSRAWR